MCYFIWLSLKTSFDAPSVDQDYRLLLRPVVRVLGNPVTLNCASFVKYLFKHYLMPNETNQMFFAYRYLY